MTAGFIGWVGADQSLPPLRCPQDGCTAAINEIDVCCPEHGDMLGLPDVMAFSPDWWVRQLPLVAVVSVFPWAASLSSAVPIAGLWLIGGLFLTYLFARCFDRSRAVVPSVWALVAGTYLAFKIITSHIPPTNEVAWTWAADASLWLRWSVDIVLVVVAWRVLAGRARRSLKKATDTLARWILSGLVLTVFWLGIALVCQGRDAHAIDTLLDNGSSNRSLDIGAAHDWALLLAIVSLVGSAVFALVHGLARSHERRTNVRVLVPTPNLPKTLGWKAKTRANVGARRTQRALSIDKIADGLSLSIAAVSEAIVLSLLTMFWLVVAAACTAINALARAICIVVLKIAYAIADVASNVVSAFVALGLGALDAAIEVLPPSLFLFASAALMWRSSVDIGQYLVTGGLQNALLGGLAALVIVSTLFAVVVLTSGANGRLALRAFREFTMDRLPYVLVLVVVGGWIGAIAGSLGLGPMRVGPVTIGGTILLAAVGVIAWIRLRLPAGRMHSRQAWPG